MFRPKRDIHMDLTKAQRTWKKKEEGEEHKRQRMGSVRKTERKGRHDFPSVCGGKGLL